MYKDIIVFIEQRDNQVAKVGLELLGRARSIADNLNQKVIAVILGSDIKRFAEEIIKKGADKVIVVENEILKEYLTEPYTKVFFHIIKKYEPEIVLFGATSIGRDLAPRLAARIHTGLTADCTSLDIDEKTGNLLMTRPAFGGNLMATIVCENYRPQMATVRPGVMVQLDIDPNRKGEILTENIEIEASDLKVEIKEVLKIKERKKDITESKILVSVGRGIGSPERLDKIQELARELKAEISSSRAVVDANWLSKEHQVGQTGKTVRPELYFALGISGAIQHIAGIEDSKFIIAINKDENAPIFDVADLGIVGDLHTIIPKIIEKLKKVKD